MNIQPEIVKSRAFRATKEWLDSGKPFDEDEVFARAYLLYQHGKHLKPSSIRYRIKQSLTYIQDNG